MTEQAPWRLPNGSVIGDRYEVTGFLAQGGTADVYRATDQVLGRAVAVKVYRPGFQADTERERFVSEVKVLASLSHPHLVDLYDAGIRDESPWYAMKLVDGGTFAGLRKPLPLDRLGTIGAQLARALAHIHARGIVHRDVKPANVLLDAEQSAYLSDLGLARLMDSAGITSTGVLVGTAAYFSPEQALGRSVKPATDIYALGLVLLEGITGHREYLGSPVEAALARLNRPPDIPAALAPGWGELLREMTAPDPLDRPTATEVAERCAALAGNPQPMQPLPLGPATAETAALHRAGWTAALRRPGRARRAAALLGASMALATGLVLVDVPFVPGSGVLGPPADAGEPMNPAEADSSAEPADRHRPSPTSTEPASDAGLTDPASNSGWPTGAPSDGGFGSGAEDTDWAAGSTASAAGSATPSTAVGTEGTTDPGGTGEESPGSSESSEPSASPSGDPQSPSSSAEPTSSGPRGQGSGSGPPTTPPGQAKKRTTSPAS